MRCLLVCALLLGLVGVAAAADWSNKAPTIVKNSPDMPIPAAVRQGGDTVLNATVIPGLPYTDAGTTAGYANDYDEVCPYTGSTAPDVVYSYVAEFTGGIYVDLCGSSYDTKVYVYDSGLNSVGCNDDAYFDDACGVYVSALYGVPVVSGEQYFIVVDGYGTASGAYQILVEEILGPCVPCPPDGYLENEPELVENYADTWNGGCNQDPINPILQPLTGDSVADYELTLCGVGGWYNYFGSFYRDLDWYEMIFGPTGTVEVQGIAMSYFVMGIVPSCEAGAFDPYVIMDVCAEGFLTLSGAPGSAAMFVAGAADWSGNPGDTFDYTIHFSGIEETVATESTTWGGVKSLYR